MLNLAAAPGIDSQSSRAQPLLSSQGNEKPQMRTMGLSCGIIHTVLKDLLAQLKVCTTS